MSTISLKGGTEKKIKVRILTIAKRGNSLAEPTSGRVRGVNNLYDILFVGISVSILYYAFLLSGINLNKTFAPRTEFRAGCFLKQKNTSKACDLFVLSKYKCLCFKWRESLFFKVKYGIIYKQ